MKVTIDVKCTPEEARAFLGLPDVAPLQDEMMQHMRDQMNQAAAAMSPDQFMKTLFPTELYGGAEGLAEMQKQFWASFTGEKK